MVIGKSLLGAGARIPCIRTRLQVKFLGSFHVLSISRTQQDTSLNTGGWLGRGVNAHSCFTAVYNQPVKSCCGICVLTFPVLISQVSCLLQTPLSLPDAPQPQPDSFGFPTRP